MRRRPRVVLVTLLGLAFAALRPPAGIAQDSGAAPFTASNAMIAMRDGVRLNTRIFVPRQQAGPLPILLLRTPYGVSGAAGRLTGSLKTLVLGFASLSDVHWTASGQVILMTLVGGLGTLSGPLVGSAVVVLLENKIGDFGHLMARITTIDWFNTLGESVTMVTGLIFVICVLAFRRGIMGEIIALMSRRR